MFAPIHRQLWRLAAPIMLANIAVPLLGLVDTAIMGHMPNPLYLAAIAVGSILFSVVYWAMGFLRMSTTGLAAQALGGMEKGGDGHAVGLVLARACGLGGLIGVAAVLLQIPIAAIAFPLIGAEEQVSEAARRYYDIRIWSAPATLMQFALIGWFIGTHHAKTALVVQAFLNALNAALDALFVLVLDMDIAGVALGTLIAEYAALILSLALAARLMRRRYAVTVTDILRHGALLHGPAWARLLTMNGDIFLRTCCVIAAYFIFTALGGRLGTQYLAANAVLLNFVMLLSFGLDGVAFATEALVGADHGAKDQTRLRQTVRVGFFWAALLALAYTAIFAVLGHDLVRLLTDMADVRSVAATYLIWCTLMPLAAVWSYQLDGMFIGLTLTRPMRNTMAAALAVYLVALALLTPPFGNHGLWASFMIFMAARGLFMAISYRRLAPTAQTGL